MTLAALLIVALLVTTPTERDGSAPRSGAPADRLPPGPLVVESAPGPPAGVVGIEPGVAQVRVEPGRSVQPEFLVTNGADAPLDLGLVVAPAVPAPDGGPRVTEAHEGPPSGVPSAADWFVLPASGLHLDPGERARLRPTISVPAKAEPGGYVAALRVAARSGSGDAPRSAPEVVAFLLVEVPSTSGGTTPRVAATPALARSGLSGAEARVLLDADLSQVVTGRLTVSSWWGDTLVDVAIPPTIVLLAVPRTQQVLFRAPVLPGPYRLVTSLETSSGETLSVKTTAWLWNPLATLIGLLVVLMIAAPVMIRMPLRRGS